jgi:hypothetical protein
MGFFFGIIATFIFNEFLLKILFFVGKYIEKKDFTPVYSINNVFLYYLFINSNSLLKWMLEPT